MTMTDERLERYAELAVRVGANVQAGQEVFVHPMVEHWELGRAVVRQAYRAVGLGWILAPTGWPVLRPVFDWLYLGFARYRVRLGRAFGRPDGGWTLSRSTWRSLEGPSAQRRYTILYREYFCPQNEPIRSAGEGVRALQDGGHPFAKGFGAVGPR